MPITVTPVLSSVVGYVEDIRDQISTLIRFLIMNPGRTSSLWEDQLMSFRTLAAQHEDSRESFAGILEDKIKSTLKRMFRDYNFEVKVEPSDYIEGVDDGRYTLTFDIFMIHYDQHGNQTKEPAFISGKIKIGENNDILLEYNRTLDNLTLQSQRRY